eukprot:GSMAST32.ASY1.ANO1.2407.1 assembled CDS
MFVVKRSGEKQPVQFDKITARIKKLCWGLAIDPTLIAQKVVMGVYPGVTTVELDHFSKLAARIEVSNLHKNTLKSWAKTCKTGLNASLISDDVMEIAEKYADQLDAAIIYDRDYDYGYFGFKTLERAYLLRVNGVIDNIPKVLETYEMMSTKHYTHATPTLFNAGTRRPQMSSYSIEGIYDTLKNCACISKYAGGIGISIHNIRGSNSYILFNDTARYVDQGGGKRKGSFAVYLEPWHCDILEFLQLKKNHGKEEARARDLFYGLWNQDWSLFCPNECPGLADCHSEEFVALYTKYENSGKARTTMKAQKLWFQILESQIETGTPYMCFKDACNSKSNQKNLGTIKSSNLCTEIMEYTSPDEIAFVDAKNRTYDFEKLVKVSEMCAYNLNQVIDLNYYPVEEARNSNMLQGLADAFMLMKYPWESPEAKQLNKDIFEAIYYGAMKSSIESAKKDGPYSTFQGSPLSEGKFQFDLWGVTPESGRFDWDALRTEVMKHASTSQILGNNECFEPYTSNIYSRRVLAGEFTVVNRHMLTELIDLGLWTPEVRNQLIADGGSTKQLFKTVWEIKQKCLLDMSADRGAYVCQSQSLNVHMAAPNTGKLTSMHFYAWKKGLKTGMYYLRTRPKVDAIQFTVDQASLKVTRAMKDTTISGTENKAPTNVLKVKKESASKSAPGIAPSRNEVEECLNCGS